MGYKITLPNTWLVGRRSFYPGVYRVPEDMPDDLAVRALEEANAERLGEAPKPKRFTGRKKPAPENKATAPAETKTPETKPKGEPDKGGADAPAKD